MILAIAGERRKDFLQLNCFWTLNEEHELRSFSENKIDFGLAFSLYFEGSISTHLAGGLR
jgi:hypothetical protein